MRRDQGTMLFQGDMTMGDGQREMPVRGRYCVLQAEDVKLEGKWLSIGRVVDNDVVINDYTVSKLHAHIREDDGGEGWWVEDLGSTNKSFANGEQLEPHRAVLVKSWAVLRFGRLNFTLLGPSAFHAFLVE